MANTIDPLGGSYFVEALTNEMEEKAWEYIQKIDAMGGMLAAIEKGFPQMEIADAAYHYQKQIDAEEKVMVGVNKYVTDAKQEIPVARDRRAGRRGADRTPPAVKQTARLPGRPAGASTT